MRRRFMRVATCAVALLIVAAGVVASPAWACRAGAKKESCCCPPQRDAPGTTVKRGCCCAVAPRDPQQKTVPVVVTSPLPDEIALVASVVEAPLVLLGSTTGVDVDVRKARPPPRSLLSLCTSFLL